MTAIQPLEKHCGSASNPWKPYPVYKPSGVEWLGDVPVGWEVKRGRFVMRVNPSCPRFKAVEPTDEVSFVPMEAVGIMGGLNLEQTREIADISSGYTQFQNGDVVVAKITPCFENGKGALASGLRNGAACGTTELHVLRAMETLDSRFLFFLSISDLFRKCGEAEMYGAGGQKRVPPEFAKDFRTPLPPTTEQRAIADFLDQETGKIDRLVAKKRELIRKLKEERAALITRAVTRGLNADAKLKPSGVEWLGDVPVGWQTKKLRYLCRVQTGGRDTVDALDDGRYPFYVRSQTIERIDSFSADCEAILTAGDGVGVGKVFHYHHRGPFDFHQRVYMLNDFKLVSGRFLFLFLREFFYRVALEGNAKSTVDSLRMPLFLGFIVPIPPLAEQRAIADFLDRKTSKIDRLATKVEEGIARLQEYRAALITAAVTGKIDVSASLNEGTRKTGGEGKGRLRENGRRYPEGIEGVDPTWQVR